jgi:hypothetical protein
MSKAEMVIRRILGVSLVLGVLCVTGSLAQNVVRLNPAAPALYGLMSWWRGVPGLTGATRIPDLLGVLGGTPVNMGMGATSGWSPTSRPGGYAQINFDGIDDHVTLGIHSRYDFADTTFTIMFWYMSAGITIDRQYLVALRVGNGALCTPNCGGWFVSIDTDGTIQARILASGNITAAQRNTLTTTHLTPVWTHVAAVITTNTTDGTGNDVAIYINGVPDQGARVTNAGDVYTVLTGWPLTLGALSDQEANSFFLGALDDIQLYNRGLSATEIAERYRASTQGDLAALGRAAPLVDATAPMTPAAAARTTGSFFPFFR